MMVSRGDHIPVTSEMTTMTFVNNTVATDCAPTVPTCKHKDVTCQEYAESKGHIVQYIHFLDSGCTRGSVNKHERLTGSGYIYREVKQLAGGVERPWGM